MIQVVSWNIAMRHQAVEELLAMDADVALLQEVGTGALEVLKEAGGNVVVSSQNPWEPWPRAHYGSWPMVVKLSDRVEVQWFRQVLPTTPQEEDDEIAVSNVGIIAAARVIPLTGGEPFMAVSMYARWFSPHQTVGSPYIYSDAAAHHIISDLSAFIGDADTTGHRILAAGDLNNIYGANKGNLLIVWYERDRGVFGRMDAMGLEFMGPQHPAGRLANPPPQGMPEDTKNGPTFHAGSQLDYVFASRGDSTTGCGPGPSTAGHAGRYQERSDLSCRESAGLRVRVARGFHHRVRTRALNGSSTPRTSGGPATTAGC